MIARFPCWAAAFLLSFTVAAGALPKITIAKNSRGFTTENGQPFSPFGLTYYRPGTGWAPQLWKKFDPAATRQDFAKMKELGVNCVRVFLTFGSFYNAAGTLDETGLAKFDQFLAIAESAGIYVHPTGPDHWEGLPGWMHGNRIGDVEALGALEQFWKLFAARYRNRPVIFAYDLRNEPEVGWETEALQRRWNEWVAAHYGSLEKAARAWGNSNILEGVRLKVPQPRNVSTRELLDFQHCREDLADEWTQRQTVAIKSVDSNALVTVGLIQWSVPSVLPRLQHYSGFRPERQARFLDFLEFHFYPLENGAYEYASAASAERNLAYFSSVLREVARPGKPVVLAEFGWYGGGKPSFDRNRHPAATQQQQAEWCRSLVAVSAGQATGWLNWGLYDQPEATDVSQLTGLLQADGQIKAWGKEFQKLSLEIRRGLPAAALPAEPKLDWDACLTSLAAEKQFREEFLGAFKKIRSAERER